MKSGKHFLCLLCLTLGLSLLISACSDEKEKGDYSGVSELIAGRNKARYEVAEKPSQKKQVTQKRISGQSSPSVQRPKPKPEQINSVVLFEQNIDIVGTDSQKRLAKGVAYINKQGQIVRIKIIRD